MQGYWNPDAEQKSELIHARLMSLIPPPPPHNGDEPLNEWARRHNAAWHEQQRRLDTLGRDRWAMLGSEYAGDD